MQKPKIVYILGSGRSGSTILDMLLGNHADIESFGELANLATAGWINNEYCSSGVRVNDSPFWNNVKSKFLEKANDEKAIVKFSALTKTINKKGNILNHFFLKKLPLHLKKDFLFFNECLVEALIEVTGKNIIVDSSKMPLRGEMLALSEKFDVYFIHLIRDGRKVLQSLQVEFKASLEEGIQQTIKKRNLFKVAFFWRVMNTCSERVCAKYKEKSIAVKYESFLKNPASELNKVGSLLNLNMQAVIDIAVSKQIIKPYYTVAGNRIRMQKGVRLQEYKPRANTKKSANENFFQLLNRGLLKKYKYL